MYNWYFLDVYLGKILVVVYIIMVFELIIFGWIFSRIFIGILGVFNM